MDQQPFDGGTGGTGEPLRLPPWEERERWGLLNALYATAKDVLLAPGQFFHRMPTRLGLGQPLLFGIVMTFLATLFDFIWGLSGSSLQRVLDRQVGEFLRLPVILGVFWVLSPLLAIVQIMVRSVVFHLCLMLAGGNRLGFEATFRVVAYSRAAGVISMLPICGGFVAAIWEIVVTVVGLARIHGIEEWRAAVAVLVPVVLFLGSCGGLLAILIGAGMLM